METYINKRDAACLEWIIIELKQGLINETQIDFLKRLLLETADLSQCMTLKK